MKDFLPVIAASVIDGTGSISYHPYFFVANALISICCSWLLIKLNPWLSIVASVLALYFSFVTIRMVWRAWMWLDKRNGEHLDFYYIIAAIASVVACNVAISALLTFRLTRRAARQAENVERSQK